MGEEQKEPNLSEKGIHDYHLIQLALEKGDQKAYAELMKRYRDSIYFMMLKMVNNKDDADDLTIEAFGKAFKQLKQYSPKYAFSTWLFKIASNNSIDFIRRKKMITYSIDKTFGNEEGGELKMDVKAKDLNPEENLVKKQKIKLMRAIVENLKPHYKQLIEMRYFQELSYDEIAEKLDLPVGTVKAQLFRAREFLATILKNSEEKI